MPWRAIIWATCGLAVLAVAGFFGWLLTLPPEPTVRAPPSIHEAELARTVDLLSPPKSNERPVVAILGINDATETTDYLMPYGILKRADVADVVAVATAPGPVQLYPALKVDPDSTTAAFDLRYPGGADYVIVPAMSRDDDPAALDWIKAQAAKGATVIGVCAGAKVVAAAGLLDGKSATSHWYYLPEMLKEHPEIRYVRDRRLVADEGVATTTGITASMPSMLTLIEAIAGREKAQAVATDLGLDRWDLRHDSAAFALSRPFVSNVLRNTVRLGRNDDVRIGLHAGIDEVSLALVADAWSRTYRSRAISVADGPVETRSGMRIYPDVPPGETPPAALEPDRPAQALERALRSIEVRYGPGTKRLVADQLEYPQR